MAGKFLALGLVAWPLLGVSQGAANRQPVRGPWPLVSLAALGTVRWRCDPGRHPGLAPGLAGLALGFDASATDRRAHSACTPVVGRSSHG
ncbi:MAG TPA: hypothetical protein VF002_08590 [Gaiellaceae bacterium]